MDLNQFYDENTKTLNLSGRIPKNKGEFQYEKSTQIQI